VTRDVTLITTPLFYARTPTAAGTPHCFLLANTFWEPNDVRNFPMSLRVFRQKPLIKYLFFGAFFLIIVYGLFQFGPHYYQSTPLSTGLHSSSAVPAEVWTERREQVKLSFQHAYHGYEQYAAPSDELLPLSKYAINQCVVFSCLFQISLAIDCFRFNRWGLTIFDSLDTMILMGLEEEYQRALVHVQKTDFSLPPVCDYFALYAYTTKHFTAILRSLLRDCDKIPWWITIRLCVDGQSHASTQG
jgi:hypothetical protein